jgi:hypothetical protein
MNEHATEFVTDARKFFAISMTLTCFLGTPSAAQDPTALPMLESSPVIKTAIFEASSSDDAGSDSAAFVFDSSSKESSQNAIFEQAAFENGSAVGDEAQPRRSAMLCSCDLQTHHGTCPACNQRQRTWLNDSSFFAGGWLQQGVTLNPDDPNNRLNAPVLFNDRSNDYQLNQLYFYLGKESQIDGTNWDWGARFDLNYGTDSRFVTVPGLEEHDDRTPRWNSETSDYGLALPQAYLDIGTPIGPYGSTIRVGHFYALAGYETFAAPDNFFYSHSYSYLYGQPFTYSGAMWFAKLRPTVAGAVAVTTGWDSLYSEGDEWGIRAGLMKKSIDDRTTLALSGYAGNEFTGITTLGGPQDDARVWANLVLRHYLQPKLYYVLELEFGRQDGAVVVLDTLNNTIGFDDGQWWGINQYLVHQFNECWSAGLRVEWFRDEGNSRVGVPIEYDPGGPVFDGNDYFELTAGLNWRPHSRVLLRQEIRWDNSDVKSNPNVPGGIAGIRPFDDRSDDNQLTIATDLILNF